MQSRLEFPANGNLRMYNMFPFRRYVNGDIGIKNMSCYVHEIAEMGYNAVWINPLQATGTMKQDHPDGERQVSGSLYAMADDQAFNPLIFPNSTQSECEVLLKAWTQEVRDNGMFPLFDLVLNHIAINEGEDAPLKIKLIEAGKKHKIRLLHPDINERWPDIQGIDYYKDDYMEHKGLNTDPKFLDEDKIDLVFEILWEPMIRRYITDYGFMGVRVDALTHVPVPVQQRAFNLVQKLVRETHGTDAIIVGELMVANPVAFLPALSNCGLTHCLHPCSFTWGFNTDGGYHNDNKKSPFFSQNQELAETVLIPPKNLAKDFSKLLLVDSLDSMDTLEKKTVYIFKKKGVYQFALNADANDICFGKAVTGPLSDIIPDDRILQNFITKYQMSEAASQQISQQSVEIKKKLEEIAQKNRNLAAQHFNPIEGQIRLAAEDYRSKKAINDGEKKTLDNQKKAANKQEQAQLTVMDALLQELLNNDLLKAQYKASNPQKNIGGLIGVIGNHDVGTLKAKIMLDIAYTRALSNATGSSEKIKEAEQNYRNFKNTIKGIQNTSDLITKLQSAFHLNDLEKKQLFLDLNMRMREKIFIQSMMCTGGWYSMAGDELGICHKPEVFAEFANDYKRVGSSLESRCQSETRSHDFRSFISGMNDLLNRMPGASYEDTTNLHYTVLDNEIFGERPASFLFMALRYSAKTHQHYLVCHANETIGSKELAAAIGPVLAKIENCDVSFVNRKGETSQLNWVNGVLKEPHVQISNQMFFKAPVKADKMSTPESGNESSRDKWCDIMKGLLS